MKKRLLILATALQVLFTVFPAVSAPQSLWGLIYDEKNVPISGVKVSVTQSGKEVSSSTTGVDGAYSFTLNNGSYSMRLTPPNTNYSALLAFDIDVPLPQALNFYLTKPIPGRSFITGYVKLPKGFDIEGSVNFGAPGPIDRSTGFFKLTPTAGTTGAFSVGGQTLGDSVSFKVLGKTPMAILQDMMIDYNLPLYRQRIRIMTDKGTPVQGAFIDGGVGSMVSTTTPNVAMAPVEGLGEFEGTWRVYSGTMQSDKDGYVTLPALSFGKAVPANFTVVGTAGYATQTFQTTVGGGDVTLTLTNPLPSLKGTVKDASGKPIPGIVVKMMTNDPGARTQSGGGGAAKADGSFEFFAAPNPNYVLSVEYRRADDPKNTFYFSTNSDKTNASIPQTKPAELVVPLQTTRVRVLDPNGKPVVGSLVELKPARTSQTEYTGKVTLMAGSAAQNIYSYSTGVTDVNGYVTLPTVKFDAEVDGVYVAGPPAGDNWTYVVSTQKMGLGKDVTLTLQRPFVTVSGRFYFTDGTPRSYSSGSWPSFSSVTNNGSSQMTSFTPEGNFVAKVPTGITGRWTIGCGGIDKNRAADFVPCIAGGPTTVASSDWTQDLPIPTAKTSIQVVTADGKGIQNVKVLVNSGMVSKSSVQLFPGQTPYEASYISTATTDANGFATIVNLKLATPQKVYLELTPDPSSRYQTRGLNITIGDNSKNVIVLQILKPVIASVTVSVINGIRTATIMGENFAGVTGVTAGTFSFNEFTNKTGAVTKQGFTVVSANQITFPIPPGLTTATVTVTNGGGSATSGVIKFN
ncbi:MAG: SdrD B-like domain [Actinomycetota bacterium]|jgi:hypothetical protein